jgi:hypothetical protein
MHEFVVRPASQVVVAFVIAGVVAGCGSAAPAVSFSTAASPTVGAVPTAAPTPAPSGTSALTPAPTSAPTPTAATTVIPTATLTASPAPTSSTTPKPIRTLAPGETARPSPMDITPYLTVHVTLLNLADEAVDVSIDFSDSGQTGTVSKLHLESFDGLAESIPEGEYLLTFTRASAPSKPATCRIKVKDGDEVHFAVFAKDITIVSPGAPPKASADLFVGSSPLCVT